MTTTLVRRSDLPVLVDDFFFDGGALLPRFFDFNGGMLSSDLTENIPSVNIIENKGDYKIEVAAPGLEKKDFKVEVDNGYLTISAERQEEKKEEKKNFSRREFSYNSFSRSFNLPENVITDKIDAQYLNGVLNLTVPKKEVTVSKPVKEIKIS